MKPRPLSCSSKSAEADRQERPTDPGEHAGRDDGAVADRVDDDADRVGCPWMFSYRSDPKADGCLEEDEAA